MVANPRSLASSNGWVSAVCPEFLRRWSEFVDPDKRLEAEGPFLEKLMRGNPVSVLDTAMGMGLEAVFFAEHGCVVTGNEISDGFREVACAYAARKGVGLRVTNVDWRKLDSAFVNTRFDLVLLLGNSFSLLRDCEERRLVARNLRKVCAEGGRLVIDQRNFDYILNDGDAVVRGEFRYSAKIMFCGQTVVGRPVSVRDDRVRFAYAPAGLEPLGFLDMHPFRMGEIAFLFADVGFSDIDIYSDFRPGVADDADFYTYVMK